jgi:hypothetical protein
MLTLESVGQPHEDISPPSFLERWFSYLDKRYIFEYLGVGRVLDNKPQIFIAWILMKMVLQ